MEISQETCCECNVIYWVAEEHQKQLIRCKSTFYCPNGHPQKYKGETESQKVAKLEEKLRYEKRCSESLERSNSALRGVITKNKNKKT